MYSSSCSVPATSRSSSSRLWRAAVGGDLVQLAGHGAEVARRAAQQQVGAARGQPQRAGPQLGVQPLAPIGRAKLGVVHHLSAVGLDGGEDGVARGHGGATAKQTRVVGARIASARRSSSTPVVPRRAPAQLREIADQDMSLGREQRNVDEARDEGLEPGGRVDDLDVLDVGAPSADCGVDEPGLVAVDQQQAGRISHGAIVSAVAGCPHPARTLGFGRVKPLTARPRRPTWSTPTRTS